MTDRKDDTDELVAFLRQRIEQALAEQQHAWDTCGAGFNVENEDILGRFFDDVRRRVSDDDRRCAVLQPDIDIIAMAIMDANSVPTADNVWEVYRDMARAAVNAMFREVGGGDD